MSFVTNEPLSGSVKSNIGHLEGSAGLAGVVKALLILEKGIIAPNALFEKMNPNIDAEFYNVSVPTDCIPWPSTGLRRVSVNSFGFGGSNAHVVMDDALHYLQERGLNGNHHTVHVADGALATDISVDGVNRINEKLNGQVSMNGVSSSLPRCDSDQHLRNGDIGTTGSPESQIINDIDRINPSHSGISEDPMARSPHLMVWSAADEHTLETMTQSYQDFMSGTSLSSWSAQHQLAYTLAARRSVMLWRTFAVADASTAPTSEGETCKMSSTAKPTRASGDTALAFVFTGQGAQYVNMGRNLLVYPVFRKTLQDVDAIFHGLACSWSLFGEFPQRIMEYP